MTFQHVYTGRLAQLVTVFSFPRVDLETQRGITKYWEAAYVYHPSARVLSSLFTCRRIPPYWSSSVTPSARGAVSSSIVALSAGSCSHSSKFQISPPISYTPELLAIATLKSTYRYAQKHLSLRLKFAAGSILAPLEARTHPTQVVRKFKPGDTKIRYNRPAIRYNFPRVQLKALAPVSL
ncbi:hypothetical protein BDQ17DRAFT_1433413 [Cyathus striatus]|nr:hypothetical protein BDQ17DRAFT_1433413 [Cyathus striatus]